MYSLNKYGFHCANLQETHNQSVHFVEICTKFSPSKDKECNKYKQNFIYSIEYSQFATAPIWHETRGSFAFYVVVVVENCYTEFCEIPANGKVADTA